MKLYIVQHGDAVSKEENPLRPLSEKGVHDVQLLARELVQKNINPARIFHSGKERARETAEIIAGELGLMDRVSQSAGIAPMDDAAAFAESVSRGGEDMLIASHMPFVQNLCEQLLGPGGLHGFVYSPGKLVCVLIAGGRAELYWHSE